jgi:hypothetical protein
MKSGPRPDLPQQVLQLSGWCHTILQNVRNVASDFETGLNVIRLLQALRPGKSSKKVPAEVDPECERQ